VLAEAEEFVKSMGFTMQKINLDFSPAMREVIIKGLRVMRPPPPQKRMPVRPLKIDVPEKLVVATGLNEAQPAEGVQGADTKDMTELLSLRAELASARSALEQVTREKIAAEQKSAGERGALKASCEQAMESKRLAEERLAQAVGELKKLQQAQPPQPDSGELLRLREQIDKETAAAAAAGNARNQLQAMLQGEREKIGRLEGEKSLLEQRLAGEAEKNSLIQTEAANMKQQLEAKLATALAAGSEAAGELAAMASLKQALQEAQQREEELRRHASAVEEKLATAQNRLDDLRRQMQQSDDLMQRLAMTEEELIEARQDMVKHDAVREQLAAADAEIQRLRSEQDRANELQLQLAAVEAELTMARSQLERVESIPLSETTDDTSAGEQLARLAAEKEAVESEYVRLATESREKESEIAESLSTAQAEIERLSSELEIQGQVAAMEQAALRAELRRMIVEGGAAFYTPPPAAQPLPVAQAASPPPVAPPPPPRPLPAPVAQIVEPVTEEEEEEDSAPDAPIVPDTAILQEFTSDLGGFNGGGSAMNTEFRIDTAIDAIAYSDPAEVVAVFFSSNTVQAMPDSKGIQRCKGYIVATKIGGSYQVYVAWYLTESGRVVVCLPEQQPSDSEECVLLLKDAVSYFEIVGFMMEVADLGATRRSYRSVLRRIPVLRKTPSP